MNDPFILKFMKRDAVRPKMPEIGQVLSKRLNLNLTKEEDVYLLPTTEKMEEKVAILPKRPTSRASAPSNRKRRVLDMRNNNKEMFGRTATATSIRPQTASQRKLKSIQSIFSRPAISARRIRIKRG